MHQPRPARRRFGATVKRSRANLSLLFPPAAMSYGYITIAGRRIKGLGCSRKLELRAVCSSHYPGGLGEMWNRAAVSFHATYESRGLAPWRQPLWGPWNFGNAHGTGSPCLRLRLSLWWRVWAELQVRWNCYWKSSKTGESWNLPANPNTRRYGAAEVWNIPQKPEVQILCNL